MDEKDILVLRLDLTDRSSHEAATNSVLKHFGKVRCAFGVKLLFFPMSYTCIYVHVSLLSYGKFTCQKVPEFSSLLLLVSGFQQRCSNEQIITGHCQELKIHLLDVTEFLGQLEQFRA